MDPAAFVSDLYSPGAPGPNEELRPRLLLPRGGEWGTRAGRIVQSLGGTPLVVDLIRTSEVDSPQLRRAQQLLEEGEYAWLILTSSAATTALPQQVRAQIAAVGPATAAAITRAGYHVAFMPKEFNALSLADTFHPSGNVLLLRSQLARGSASSARLLRGLEQTADRVDDVVAYRTETVQLGKASQVALARADCLLVTSASVAGALAANKAHQPVACIGPASAQASRQFGLNVVAIAHRARIEDLIDAAIAWWHHERKK